MNRFRNGQRVVCTSSTPWKKNKKILGLWFKRVPGPKKGEEVTVIRYDYDNPGYMFISGYETHGPYLDITFKPLQRDVIVKEIAIAEPSLN